MSDKSLDVVIYGATGFTGKLVVEHMQENYGNDESVSWAIAGRSEEKLKAVSEDLKIGSNVPHLLVDSNDTDSIESMVKQTKCVLNNRWALSIVWCKNFFNNASFMVLIMLIWR
jgi:short subunit dehydrogenase-like uncharacterized protein